MAGLVGGVIGAVLAVFGAPLVQGPPPLSPEAQSRVASLESDSAAMAQRLAAVESDVEPLAERVAGLETLADELEPTVRAAVEAAVAEVPTRDREALDAVAGEVEALARATEALQTAAAEAVDPLPMIEGQAERLQAIESSLEGLAGSLDEASERLEAASDEAVGGLEGRLATEAERIDALGADLEAEIETLARELDRMVGELREAASGELVAAQAALGSEVEALRDALAATEAELAAVQGEVEGLQQARSRAAAAALLVRDIDRSLDRGTPFAEPLELLIPMAAGDPTLEATLAELRPHAETGVPTLQELREDLAALAETGGPAEVAGSEFLGQTVENLRGLVQVRSADDETDVATGQLAEADAALRRGDIASAIDHVETVAGMPGAVDEAAAEAWLADARARLTAVEAQAQLDSHIRELLTATVN